MGNHGKAVVSSERRRSSFNLDYLFILISLWRHIVCMMTSSNENIFRGTGPLCGEFTGHRWIPLTKVSDAELWCFFMYAWINGSVHNRKAGDLRRHRAHYDVTVMWNYHICSIVVGNVDFSINNSSLNQQPLIAKCSSVRWFLDHLP